MSQEKFIETLKAKTKAHLKLVDEVCDVLNLSTQGAYKKINGSTNLTLTEMLKLAQHFKISIDQSIGLYDTEDIPHQFYSNTLRYKPASVLEFWNNIRNHIAELFSLNPSRVVYFANELPFHYLISFKNILRFKLFNWNNISWKLGENRTIKNNYLNLNRKSQSSLEEILGYHNNIESEEIWNVSMLTPLYNQMKHWIAARLFLDKTKIDSMFEEIRQLIGHLENTAITGTKQLVKEETGKPLSVYINHIFINSELIYIQSESISGVYTMYESPNYLRSFDTQVCSHASQWLEEVVQSSVLISKNNPIQRKTFFDTLREEYTREKAKIESLFSYINM